MEAIILAGGLGTRLKEVISDLPKPLAPICGRPFLNLLFEQLKACEGIKRIILAVGYKAHLIVEYCEKKPPNLPFLFSFESSPLGTGGALRKAADFAESEDLLILNGDSYLEFSWPEFRHSYATKRADMAIACPEVKDVSRYGHVLLDQNTQQVQHFEEKNSAHGPGWINGGVYLMKRQVILEMPAGKPFSLEVEGIPLLSKKRVFGYPCHGIFVDIGTKESYLEAQHLLRNVPCSMS